MGFAFFTCRSYTLILLNSALPSCPPPPILPFCGSHLLQSLPFPTYSAFDFCLLSHQQHFRREYLRRCLSDSGLFDLP